MGELWEDNAYPLAYLITIRTFGTWLHGDVRESVDRHGKNIYGTDRIPGNLKFHKKMLVKTKEPAFLFDKRQREIVEKTIEAVCENRKYFLYAVNALSNHVHVVIHAQTTPEKVINALKIYTTRHLRQQKLINVETRVWSRGGSRRYLWKQRQVDLATNYVLYGQGDIFAELDHSERHTP